MNLPLLSLVIPLVLPVLLQAFVLFLKHIFFIILSFLYNILWYFHIYKIELIIKVCDIFITREKSSRSNQQTLTKFLCKHLCLCLTFLWVNCWLFSDFLNVPSIIFITHHHNYGWSFCFTTTRLRTKSQNWSRLNRR